MLEDRRSRLSGEDDASVLLDAPLPESLEDRRDTGRSDMAGAEVYFFCEGEQRFRLRLRDLCSQGLSGITDAPLSVGETVIVQLEEMLMPAGQVVWTRRAWAGIRFNNMLPLPRLKRIVERQAAGTAWSPAMRAGSDLHAWWTDLDEQRRGRTTRLRAGGHRHPLAR